MKSSVGCLALSFLCLISTLASAQIYVPRYMAYQMNGIYYFYCVNDGCMGPTATMQSSSRMHLLGCVNNNTTPADQINGGGSKLAAEIDRAIDKKKSKEDAVRVANASPNDDRAQGIDRHALPQKGDKKGQRVVNGRIVAGGTVFTPNENDEVLYDFECITKGPDKRHFRVIGIHIANPPSGPKAPDPSFFAQEIEFGQKGENLKIDSFKFEGKTRGKIIVDLPGDGKSELIEIDALAVDPISP